MDMALSCGCLIKFKMSARRVCVTDMVLKCRKCRSNNTFRNALVKDLADIQDERKNNVWASSDSFTNSFSSIRSERGISGNKDSTT